MATVTKPKHALAERPWHRAMLQRHFESGRPEQWLGICCSCAISDAVACAIGQKVHGAYQIGPDRASNGSVRSSAISGHESDDQQLTVSVTVSHADCELTGAASQSSRGLLCSALCSQDFLAIGHNLRQVARSRMKTTGHTSTA